MALPNQQWPHQSAYYQRTQQQQRPAGAPRQLDLNKVAYYQRARERGAKIPGDDAPSAELGGGQMKSGVTSRPTSTQAPRCSTAAPQSTQGRGSMGGFPRVVSAGGPQVRQSLPRQDWPRAGGFPVHFLPPPPSPVQWPGPVTQQWQGQAVQHHPGQPYTEQWQTQIVCRPSYPRDPHDMVWQPLDQQAQMLPAYRGYDWQPQQAMVRRPSLQQPYRSREEFDQPTEDGHHHGSAFLADLDAALDMYGKPRDHMGDTSGMPTIERNANQAFKKRAPVPHAEDLIPRMHRLDAGLIVSPLEDRVVGSNEDRFAKQGDGFSNYTLLDEPGKACYEHPKCIKLHDPWPTSGELVVAGCMNRCEVCGVFRKGSAHFLRLHVKKYHTGPEYKPTNDSAKRVLYLSVRPEIQMKYNPKSAIKPWRKTKEELEAWEAKLGPEEVEKVKENRKLRAAAYKKQYDWQKKVGDDLEKANEEKKARAKEELRQRNRTRAAAMKNRGLTEDEP